jgi:hypothetical protein
MRRTAVRGGADAGGSLTMTDHDKLLSALVRLSSGQRLTGEESQLVARAFESERMRVSELEEQLMRISAAREGE